MTDELVSVVVVTYNSSLFIEETLDSIFQQTYRNIELIITDDCSQDNTIVICKRWIKQHANRFANVKLLTSPINTGVSANANRGHHAAIGHWVKGLAGDDLLLPEAISQYVAFMEQNPDVAFVFGKPIFFSKNSNEKEVILADQTTYQFFNLERKKQYKMLMQNACYIPAPTFFYDRYEYTRLGIKCDESIPVIDDWPLWINISKKKKTFFLLDTETVKYRIHHNSISQSMDFASPFEIAKMQMFVKYQFGYNALRHPRINCIKYIICKQQITHKKVWYQIETIAKKIDMLAHFYKKELYLRDWDIMSQVLEK